MRTLLTHSLWRRAGALVLGAVAQLALTAGLAQVAAQPARATAQSAHAGAQPARATAQSAHAGARPAHAVASPAHAVASPAHAAATPSDDAPPASTPTLGRVVAVYDGDSFLLRDASGRRQQVRIAGIDAPEKTQPYADRARRALRDRIGERELRILPIGLDRFGRRVALVFLGDSDVGLAQLRDGWAWHFERYDSDLPEGVATRYAKAQRHAREHRLGLWRDPSPIAPWLFRAQQR